MQVYPQTSTVLKTVFILIPTAVAATATLYLLIGVAGSTWTGYSLDSILYLAAFLISFSLLLAMVHRQKTWTIASLILILISMLHFGSVVLSAFPGTGERHGNSGAGVFWLYAFIAVGLIFSSIQIHHMAKFLAFALAIPITLFYAQYKVVPPLERALSKMNLSNTCVVQAKITWDAKLLEVMRIQHVSDLNLPWFFSEKSPRILQFTESKILIWRYTLGKSERLRSDLIRPEICAAGQ